MRFSFIVQGRIYVLFGIIRFLVDYFPHLFIKVYVSLILGYLQGFRSILKLCKAVHVRKTESRKFFFLRRIVVGESDVFGLALARGRCLHHIQMIDGVKIYINDREKPCLQPPKRVFGRSF